MNGPAWHGLRHGMLPQRRSGAAALTAHPPHCAIGGPGQRAALPLQGDHIEADALTALPHFLCAKPCERRRCCHGSAQPSDFRPLEGR